MKLDRKILREWIHQVLESEFSPEDDKEKDDSGVSKVLLGKKLKEAKTYEVILQQLGGNKFIAMTGAKNLGTSGKKNNLSFSIGRNSKGITHVLITLTSMDTYDMEFITMRGTKRKSKKVKGVYADMLQKIFTKMTGMDTRL